MGNLAAISIKSNHLGINISGNGVGIIGLDNRQTITYSNSIMVENPYFTNDTVNVEELTKTLKTIVENSGNVGKKAAVCFPERMAYSREYVLPKLKISEIDEAIQWQIGTIFPLQAEDIYVDWKLLSQTNTETKIVVVAVSRKFLDGLMAACVAAGIRPMSFEPSACTLARAQKDQSQTHVILEIDSFGSSASLIENGVSSLTTTSLYASVKTLDDIIVQINTSLQNLLAHRPNLQPTVYITGEKAAPQLVELLANISHLPVAMLSLPTSSSSLHVPYLAALSSLLPPESELSINLLPKSLQDQYQLESDIEIAKKTTLVGTLIGIICLFAVTGLGATSFYMSGAINKEIAQAQAVQSDALPVNIAQVSKKAQLVNQISPQKQFLPTKQLIAIEESGIAKDQIKKLTYDAARKVLQVTLSHISRENIYDVKKNLEKTQMFSQISIPLTTFSTDSNPEVTITMIMK